MATKKPTTIKENIIRGDTPLLRFPFTVAGSPADLSGWKCTLSITDQPSPANTNVPVIQISVNGDSTGIVNFQLEQGQANNDTLLLNPGTTYYGDVELNNQQTGALKRVFTPVRFQFDVDYDYTVGVV